MCDHWTARRSGRGVTAGAFATADGEGTFHRDRARIIHAEAFRRLQGKTQVLGVGESDFYRTRLTHSLETAQISSGIAESLKLKHRDAPEIARWIPPLPLIEAVALAHDIGHPPFGHGGEAALNFFMHDHGGFEANGQTLRIASRLGEFSPDTGLDLTRRAVLGLLKYPVPHARAARYGAFPDGRPPLNLDPWRPPKCVHDDEEDVLEWALEPLSSDDRRRISALDESGAGHRRAMHRSLDATIMEIGDDIAYGVHDLEDALALRLVSVRDWQTEVVARLEDHPESELIARRDFYEQRLFALSSQERKHAVSRLVARLMDSIRIERDNAFDAPLFRYRAVLCSPERETLHCLKAFVFNRVIRSPEVQALEYRGQQMLLKLFETLGANPGRLLPRDVLARYEAEINPPRAICDYLASMTNTHAAKLYLKLFSPDGGSLFERL